jgi:hypothetical protein
MSTPRFRDLDPVSQQIIKAILAAAENAKKASIATPARPAVVGAPR